MKMQININVMAYKKSSAWSIQSLEILLSRFLYIQVVIFQDEKLIKYGLKIVLNM